MKKLNAQTLIKKTKSAAQKKGVVVTPGSDADKVVNKTIEAGVEIANGGISLAARAKKKGFSLFNQAREKIHEATKPAPAKKSGPKKR